MAAGGSPFHGVGQWALSRAPEPVPGQVGQDLLPLQELGRVGLNDFSTHVSRL